MTATLSLALEVPDTGAEGPGRRYAIWVQGCPLRCKGCCNPEYLSDAGGQTVGVDTLLQRIAEQPEIEGVTLLGGEPMQQAQSLAVLLAGVQRAGLSTMVFTGYTLEELQDKAHAAAVLAATDLLVDGRYDASRPDDVRTWIGSTNQRMHFLTSRYDPNDVVFSARDTVEIRLRDGELTINGRPWGAWTPKPRRR